MLPIADMLNHKFPSECRCHCVSDNKRNGFAIEAKKDIGIGEEVTFSYGNKEPTDIFLQYGFVMNPHPFPQAVIVLCMSNVERTDQLYDEKLKIMNQFQTQGFKATSDLSCEVMTDFLRYARWIAYSGHTSYLHLIRSKKINEIIEKSKAEGIQLSFSQLKSKL